MLILPELEKLGESAEKYGFRVNIVSAVNAKFQKEYKLNYDLTVNYSVIAGEVAVEITSEGTSFTPDELLKYCDTIGICLGLTKLLGGIDF